MRRLVVVLGLCIAAAAVFVVVRDLRRGYRSTDGATLEHFTLHSRLVGRDLYEIIVHPAKPASRTLLVLLHGRSSAPSSFLNQSFFDALARLGHKAPTVLLLDGGDHSYWHNRADGAWGSMVLREAIPAGIARTHAQRVAIGGISMGGFGALDLGAKGHFCAIGGHSAALWFHGSDTPAGAFDAATDWSHFDLIAHPPHYSAPVWIDVGSSDPFHNADVTLALKIHAQLHVWPGGHEGSYWHAHMAQYLRFYANACG